MCSIYMEFLDDLSTAIVEAKYQEKTYITHKNADVGFCEIAQDYYNYVYDGLESKALEYLNN